MVRDILNMAGFELPPEAKSVPEYVLVTGVGMPESVRILCMIRVSSCVPSRISYSLEPHERLKVNQSVTIKRVRRVILSPI